jgi:type IV pilus assembly protein PilM
VAKHLVGLDIGATGVRAVQITSGRGRDASVTRAAAVDLPPGVVRNGDIIDHDQLTQSIKQLWRHGRFKSNEVALTLSNSNVVVRQLELDWVAPSEFHKALPFLVRDQLPVPVDEANLGAYVLSEQTVLSPEGAERRTVRALVVAAARDMVEQFTGVVERAGLRPHRADITPFALIRAMTPVFDPDAPLEAIVAIGADVVNVVVHQGGRPRFVRFIQNHGSASITQALMERLSLSFEDAEDLKRDVGLGKRQTATVSAAAAGSVFGGLGISAAAPDHPAAAIINREASGLIAEVRASLEFFSSQTSADTGAVSRVVLAGGGSRLGGLRQRLASELRVPVMMTDVEMRYPSLANNPSLAGRDFTVALGAGLGI